MNVLGMSAFYHDSAACLVRDGTTIAAAREERFTRKKHDAGFPRNAIDYCLRDTIRTSFSLKARPFSRSITNPTLLRLFPFALRKGRRADD
jgi:carbamoyltransferase